MKRMMTKQFLASVTHVYKIMKLLNVRIHSQYVHPTVQQLGHINKLKSTNKQPDQNVLNKRDGA